MEKEELIEQLREEVREIASTADWYRIRDCMKFFNLSVVKHKTFLEMLVILENEEITKAKEKLSYLEYDYFNKILFYKEHSLFELAECAIYSYEIAMYFNRKVERNLKVNKVMAD